MYRTGYDREKWGAARRAAEMRLGGMEDWQVGTDPFDPRSLDGMGIESTMAHDSVIPLNSVDADKWGTSGGSGADAYAYDPDALSYILRAVEALRRKGGGVGGPTGSPLPRIRRGY